MYIGIDTSNYTTSVATYDGKIVHQSKKILTVKQGEKGLRQSDAVFQHTVNIPQLITDLHIDNLQGVGVSTRPRNVDGSYMPCFLVGKSVATAIAHTHNIPLSETSHQVGHILAALYSVGRLDLIDTPFIAFHLSGGTTEALIVKPNDTEIIKADVIASSNDLKAGQAIDRTGVMLGLSFPCGKELDTLAQKSDVEFKVKPTIMGLDCSLSGVENKARQMFEKGETSENIAKFVLSYISQSVLKMLDGIIEKYGTLPVVFTGGVSSNSLLRKTIYEKYNAYFADAEFSLDNAAGTAIYAYLWEKHNL